MSAKQINICTVRGWILTKLALMIANKHGTEHQVEIAEPYCAKEGMINFYLDIFNTYKGYKREGGTHVGFFTHCIDWEDPDWLKKLDDEIGWSELDGIITMTRYHKEMLHEYGYVKPVTRLIPGNFTKSFRLSPVKLLLAQRGSEAHYGQDFVLALLNSLEPEIYLNLEFGIVGDGWEPTVARMRQMGITVEHWKDSERSTKYPESYQQWYDWCDYVFIPIHETGGPMCLLEAAACGKPVIAAKTGWVKDHVYNRGFVFEPGDVAAVRNFLACDILPERRLRRDIAKRNIHELSWDTFARMVVEFIAEVDNGASK